MKNKMLGILSILSIALVGLRFNVSIMAWIMFLPLLILVRDTRGLKGWMLIGLLLQVAFFLQILKIITDPVPIVMTILFSIPMALSAWVFVWLYEKGRRGVGDLPGVFLFASLMSLLEWFIFSTSELGSWGAMAYTQVDDLAFLQMTSLFGITFPSFFIYLSSAFIAVFLTSKDRHTLIKPAILSLIIYVLFYSYGVIRINNAATGKHVMVAAIASNMQITPKGIPDDIYLKEGTQKLIDNTHIAIQRGAKLIAWNEGATIIKKDEETDFIEKIKAISLNNRVDLVIAYIVPIDGIKKFENKYLLISKGEVLDEYYKNHPVPGEGSIKGNRIANTVNLGYAKVSGAICYDFDFPGLGRALGQKGTDIAVVPSSDWRGIDPIHGQMAIVRAIEGGYSLLRPVRAATSLAVDPYGKLRASMSYFEENDRIMMASLPTRRVQTLYSRVGDIFPMALMLFILFTGYRYRKLHTRN